MKKNVRKYFILTGLLFFLFALFTILVARFDVRPIGPQQSAVGFGAINQAVFDLLGVHLMWYVLTDWLGVAAILVAFGFAAVGMCQMISRKSIRKVDRHILLLGLFYGLVIAFYMFFEQVVINYRPVILGHGLEASYPSSHTMIVVCIMATAVPQVGRLWPNKQKLCAGMVIFATFIMVITVIGRLISGVHWFTDIAGGLLLAGALVTFHRAVIQYMDEHGPSK